MTKSKQILDRHKSTTDGAVARVIITDTNGTSARVEDMPIKQAVDLVAKALQNG